MAASASTSTSYPLSRAAGSSGSSSHHHHASSSVSLAPAASPPLSGPLQPYLALSSIQRKLPGEALRALRGFPDVDTSPPEVRRRAIGQLLDDLDPESEASAWQSWKRSPEVVSTVFRVLKILGRPPVGSESLAREKSLRILMAHAYIIPIASTRPAVQPVTSRFSASDLDTSGEGVEIPSEYPEHSKDAFRTLCNALLQHSSARQALPNIPRAVQGLMAFLRKDDAAFANTGGHAELDLQFVAARALFLVTIERGPVTGRLVERDGMIDVITEYFERYLKTLRAARRTSAVRGQTIPPMMDQLLSEHLKLLFNSTLYYARPTGTSRSSSPPMSDDGHGSGGERGSPPGSANLGASPPGVHAAAAAGLQRSNSPLLTAAGAGVKKFFKNRANGAKEKSREKEVKKEEEALGAPEMSDEAAVYFEKVVPPLISLTLSLPRAPGNPIVAPVKHAIEALMHLPMSAYPPDWVVPSISSPMTSSTSLLPALPDKVLNMLRASTEYMIGEEDVDGLGVTDGSTAEETLSAPIFLLRKMATESEAVREALRKEILPPDLDRSKPLDQRPDLFAGRLLILAKSPTCPSCSHGTHELLFTLCERKPYLFSEQIGYGNATGFLHNIGSNIPPPSNWFSDDGHEINSMSGAHETREPGAADDSDGVPGGRRRAPHPMDDMTEEEKEAEFDKLMTSLDRLNKTGVIKAEMPGMNREMASRFEEVDERDREEERKRDDRDEREAAEEMRKYKARTRRGMAR